MTLLEKYNFKIHSNNTGDNNSVFSQNVCSNYSINSPANMQMSLGNIANLDIFIVILMILNKYVV